jgi:hypothetical protein
LTTPSTSPSKKSRKLEQRAQAAVDADNLKKIIRHRKEVAAEFDAHMAKAVNLLADYKLACEAAAALAPVPPTAIQMLPPGSWSNHDDRGGSFWRFRSASVPAWRHQAEVRFRLHLPTPSANDCSHKSQKPVGKSEPVCK